MKNANVENIISVMYGLRFDNGMQMLHEAKLNVNTGELMDYVEINSNAVKGISPSMELVECLTTINPYEVIVKEVINQKGKKFIKEGFSSDELAILKSID